MRAEDPIKEEKTIFEKLKELGEKLFRKRPKKECYFVNSYDIETDDELDYLEKINTAVMQSGITMNEVRKIILNDGGVNKN